MFQYEIDQYEIDTRGFAAHAGARLVRRMRGSAAGRGLLDQSDRDS
jgi:hypothetical protein